MKKTTITDFVQTEYKSFWKHTNTSKNAINPKEGLKEVERKIMFAAKELNLQLYSPVLTRKLASDTGLYHISGEASVQDTVKSMASVYRRQLETTMLKGVGAFPTSASNEGSAARYTQIQATPLGRKIFEDIDFCPWIVDDTGIEQVEYIVPPLPMVLIRGTKGIGVGKSCYIAERPYEEVYKWARKVIDAAYPDKSGSNWSERFLKAAESKNLKKTEEIREFYDDSLVHDDISNEAKIKKITPPDPYDHNGCPTTYDPKTKVVTFFPKIEKEVINKKTHYYITALPIETSDKIVQANIKKKYGDKVADLCEDHSGDGYPVKFEIPAKVAKDEENFYAIKAKKAFTEAYCIWDKDLDTVRIIKYLYPILLEWYRAREEVVTRRLYKSCSSTKYKIYCNNLIKQYYEAREAGKIKKEEDAIKLFGEEDGRYLLNLPDKTYIRENIDKLQENNKKLEDKIKEYIDSIHNIKDFIMDEWDTVAKENRKYLESFGDEDE